MEEYSDIYQRLNTKPTSIEHILEIKDWIETIPVSVKAQEDIIRRYLLEYEVLDSFWWALDDNEFEAKWEAYGWPRRIQKKVEETQLYLEKETSFFKHKQLEDQINLEDQLETINVEVNRLQTLNDVEAVHEIANDVRKNWKTLKDLQEFGLLLNQRQVLFGMPMVPYDTIKDLIREFEPYRNLWVTASDWLKSKEIYIDNPLGNIDADSIDRVVNEYYKNIIKALRVFNEIPAMLKVAQNIKTQIEEFKPLIPLIKALKNPGLRQWHMEELSKTAGFQISLNSALTFQKCLQMGIIEHFDEVMEVSDNAAKEYVIEEALEKIEKEWKDTTLEVTEHKNTDTYIMKVADETLQMLDDHTIAVQQLSFSPFKGALEKKIDEWEAKLRYNRLLLEEWMNCQKRWMWLEPIFTSEDITKQLPQQSKKFKTMDRSWRRIMKNASMNKNVLVICSDERLFDSLKDCNKILDLVERGLSDYLEMKRGAFPRFYFLSDDELLEILSQAKNPLAVQPHLRKCFENIHKLEFVKLDVVKTKSCPNPVDLEITRMFSAEGESVELIPHMQPEGNVEQWLLRVEEVMRNTIRECLGRALEEIDKTDQSVWVLSWPGQVVIACCQAYWTAQVEHAILSGTLSEYMDVMKEFLNMLRNLVKGPLKRVERQVLSALIVIEVHARDVLTKLIDLHVTSCNEFDWISQLRYYWIQTEMKFSLVFS
ncbi:hypothetical protein LSTR_LSTR015915 [Laodelphax striatellus]|uniref:Dynein heavy chain linker domain-containing protein n=1 Tax=Laodelphax striatellus TaxID=195883 RepID=A0A482WNS6_LAOST|nr:hypothetical protein LSTR_LSTR015915 [Laodelphax striatellus]